MEFVDYVEIGDDGWWFIVGVIGKVFIGGDQW